MKVKGRDHKNKGQKNGDWFSYLMSKSLNWTLIYLTHESQSLRKGSCPEWMENSTKVRRDQPCVRNRPRAPPNGTGNWKCHPDFVLIHFNDTRCPYGQLCSRRERLKWPSSSKYSWYSMNISWRSWDLPPSWLFLSWDKL